MKAPLVALAVAVALAAAPQGKPVNVRCPVKTDKKAQADITSSYKGRVIAFCCEECLNAFNASPEEYAAKMPELKGPSLVNENCPVDGNPANVGFAVNISGKRVGFCTAACRSKFSRAPETFLANLPELMLKKPAEPKKGEPAKPPPTGPCDCKKVVKGPHCEECKKDLMPDDMRGGTCKRCETKAVLLEYCVKLVPAPPPAEGEEPLTGLVEDRGRITYQCPSCNAAAARAADLKHAPECKSFVGVKKVCAKSGMAPHATDK